MVTTFVIRKGYVHCKEQELTNKELKTLARSITPGALLVKCMQYGLHEELSCGCSLTKLVTKYKHLPTDDLTCYFTTDENNNLEICQSSCMGNGHEHTLNRQIICRAYGILVLDAAYKKNKSLSFTIE